MTGSRPDVSVVLVTHEHGDELPACLQSLARATAELRAELVLVDNQSADRSFAIAKEMAPRPATLLRNYRRRGFSANANEGIRVSTADAILVLNPDTVVGEQAIVELLNHLRAHPEIGVLAPALYSPDATVQPSRRRFPTLGSVVARRSPLRRWMRPSASNRKHLMLDVAADEPHHVDWALGACLMLNRAALNDVGLFDEGYRLYVEDIDLCFRMHQKGWQVVYLPSAKVEHHHAAVTDRRWLTWRTVAHYRGMLRFVRKHGL